jgi:hypothetical protein
VLGAASALVAALAAAPGAWAGTYDVVSCGAPGAAGVNRAWVPEFGGFGSVPPDPSSYQVVDRCPGDLLAQSAPPPGNAPFLTSGNWVFTAPSGTRITRLETWRFGVKLRTNSGDPDPNNGDQGDTWKIFARDENASIIGGVFGETCETKPGDIGCSFGKDAGVTEASRAVYGINVGKISYTVSCENLYGGCPRYFDDGTNRAPIASIKLFGTRVTIDDESRPSLSPRGLLLSPGWRRPSDTVVYDASDNTGIREVRLEAAGRTRRDARPCDFRVPVPCSNPRGRTLALPSDVPDGVQTVRVVAVDPAGNAATVERQVSLDGTPPAALLERARGRRIVLSVVDATSGVASAALEVRNRSTEPFRTLASTLANGTLRAKLDRGRASRVDMRVTVRDNAGNVTQGNPTRLAVTSARVGRRSRRVRSGRVKVPFGRPARLRGRLTLSGGHALAGQTIVATAAVRRHGARSQFAGTATTGRRGRFSLAVPAGPSRTYRLVFNGAGDALGAARGVSVRVPASSTIRASRTRLLGAARVRFHGRLRNRGQRIPGRGLVLVLQGRSAGKWRTFADTRTNRRGRWRASYFFRGQPGSYPIRARIRKQSRYPFELGYSRRLTVRVG